MAPPRQEPWNLGIVVPADDKSGNRLIDGLDDHGIVVPADSMAIAVSKSTDADVLSGVRMAAAGIGLMRIVLDPSEAMKTVLGQPCVLEPCTEFDQGEARGHKCYITPLDAEPLPTRLFSSRQIWVGANGDWLAYLQKNGGIQLHNVYTT
ncbi:hypothetical protein ZWY2020_029102 [Hordeum vulgare]|nr:hypothetical protein ZWY2020_029102 [Hordeum vulgare]